MKLHACIFFKYLNHLLYLWAQCFVKYPTSVISFVGTYVTAVHSKTVVLLLSVYYFPTVLWGFEVGCCFVVQYLVLFLVLQSPRCGKDKSLLLYFNCLLMSCDC